MLNRGQQLRIEADYDNAVFLAVPVQVWQQGAILDYGSLIQEHNDTAVRIGDVWYLKTVCEFKVR